MKVPTNLELISAALHELSDVIDYLESERGEEAPLYRELSGVEEKLETIMNRYMEK